MGRVTRKPGMKEPVAEIGLRFRFFPILIRFSGYAKK
jgi:hypothetical protein